MLPEIYDENLSISVTHLNLLVFKHITANSRFKKSKNEKLIWCKNCPYVIVCGILFHLIHLLIKPASSM